MAKSNRVHPQNIVILDSSLRENILFGSDPNIYTDNKVLDVIKKVELTNFLRDLNLNCLIQ